MTRIYDHLKDQQRNDKIKGSRLNDELDNLYTSVANAVTFANPSGSVGLTAVNGVATTSMRSDAAPALSQAISPTWTGNHSFSPSSGDAITITATGKLISSTKFNIVGTDGSTNIGNAVTPDSLLTVNGNTVASPVAAPATTYIHIIGADNAIPRITFDSFNGAGGAVGGVLGARHARGTAASPTAIQANDAIFVFGAFGHQGSGAYGSAASQIQFTASENFSSGHNGQAVMIVTVPTGTSAPATSTSFQPSGGVSIGTATDGGVGSLLANTSIKSQGATAGIGYATGAGGTVAQSTSKATGVTLNKISGQITTDTSGIIAGASQGFTFTNSTIAATDVVLISMASGGSLNSYNIMVDAVTAGSCHISMHNKTAGNLSEALVLNFAVVKAVTS